LALRGSDAPALDVLRSHLVRRDTLLLLDMYQRRGFRLAGIRARAICRARELKPTIPTIGRYGILMSDELILVRPLP
jgi:hypothetical protein